jgi:hypothetical protein
MNNLKVFEKLSMSEENNHKAHYNLRIVRKLLFPFDVQIGSFYFRF